MRILYIDIDSLRPDHLSCYGYHALHGRVLPTATGAKLANPELTVVGVGGDGDGPWQRGARCRSEGICAPV